MNVFSKALTLVSKLFSYIKLPSYVCLFLSVLVLASCTSLSPQKQDFSNTDSSIPIQYYKHEDKEDKLIYHIATINLKNPKLSIRATEPTTNSKYETIGETTTTFANKTKSHIAINASPFSYPSTALSSKRNIEGLYIFKGNIISEPNEHYAALCFTKENRAYITNSQTIEEAKEAYFAFGGFWTILENGVIHQFADIKDARTAVGISNDGFTLYILVVEKNSNSTGLSFMECAKILQNEGAIKAIQLDGGNSTSLTFSRGESSPVYSSRKVGNSFGFFIND